MKRLALAILLMILMTVSLLTVGAAAADEYDLWVNGVQVTSENADDVLGDGTVSYDAAGNTLTLDGAELNTAYTLPDSQIGRTGVIYTQAEGANVLTINVIGNSTITADGLEVCGINVETLATYENPNPSFSLVLTGTAKLDINVHDNGNAISATTDITIQGLTLDADVIGNGNAIFAGGKVIIENNADVTLKSSVYSTVVGVGGIKISNAKADIICTGSEANAIYSETGNVIISDGAYVEASSYYPALFGNTGLEITNSTVSAYSEADNAIYSGDDLIIENSIVEAISAPPYYSISACDTVKIENSWVSSNNGIYGADINNSVQIDGSTGTVYGEAVLPGDATVPEGCVLVLREGDYLTIPEGVTLTNYGTVQVLGGSFTNNGTYVDYGKTVDENGDIINIIEGSGDFPNNWFVTVKSGNGAEDMVYRVVKGDTITLPAAPTKYGYIFLGWRCSDGHTHDAGEAVTISKDMTFTAVWGNMPDVDTGDDTDEPEVPDFPFSDVSASAWYYEAVKYAYDNGLMDGVDTYEFAPNDTLTRAMVWTIIARMSGVDTTGGSSWYAKAQEWVIANGVSDGENPSTAITRQELVTMLWRYSGSVTVTGSLTGFSDYASISEWAGQAMLWATVEGIIEGDENGALTPTATATRAQAAAVFMRFCEA